MQESVLTTILLPAALGLIMLGLGLSLAVADFSNVLTRPKAVAIALFAQVILLPAICFGLVSVLGLDPLVALLFSAISLTIGYWLPRLFQVERRLAIASGMEIGIHNSTLAITIALSPTLLNNSTIAIPAAVYGVLMFLTTLVFGYLVRRGSEVVVS